MKTQVDFKEAFDMIITIDDQVKVIQKLDVVGATIALTDLVRHITEGKGIFTNIRHDTKIVLSFYVMGFQRSLLK